MHHHQLTLIGISKPSIPNARFEVVSIQGNDLVFLDGTTLGYFPQYHRQVWGLPFGAYLDADRDLIMAPDWSEEIAKGLENQTVLGLPK